MINKFFDTLAHVILAFARRIKMFLMVKEIMSKEGELHFQRFRLLSTPWCNIYVHHILRSDEDRDPHDHPWHFASLILWGGYKEEWLGAYEDHRYWSGRNLRVRKTHPGSLITHHKKDFHKITLRSKRVWSLVFTLDRSRPSWGYQTRKGWIDHIEYRKLKNEDRLP